MDGDCRPIGVFDSGMGGLSVWREIVRRLPHESIVYYGDGKNCPYGGRSRQEVLEFVEQAMALFLEHDCKLVVLACNAATALTIDYLRDKYNNMPIVGMEPAVKPAALHSKTGVIGILATKATLNGKLFHETSERFSSQVRILSHVGEGFVELVEDDKEDSAEAQLVVARCVKPMIDAGADHLVLGCTHYPFLINTLQKIIGEHAVTIVDPAPAIALRVESLLQQGGRLSNSKSAGKLTFFTASDALYRERLERKAFNSLSVN